MKTPNIKKLIDLKIIKKCDYSKEPVKWLEVLKTNWADIQAEKLIEAYYLTMALLELDKLIKEKRID